MNKVNNEDAPVYAPIDQSLNFKTADEVVTAAMQILKSRIRNKGFSATSPESTVNYLKTQLSLLEHEEFHVLFLDNQYRLIEHRSLFRGTINSASVYPREVVKEALKLNACAVILAHNRPSGIVSPSQYNREITNKLKQALELVEIRTLDHIIIGGVDSYSFAQQGLI